MGKISGIRYLTPYSSTSPEETNTGVSKDQISGIRHITPQKTTTPTQETTTRVEEPKSTFFKSSGAWDDGYDFGDITKTALSSVGDLGINLVAGILGTGENIVDTGKYLISDIAEWTGDKAYAKMLRSSAQENTIGEWLEPATTYLDDYSVFGKKVDSLSQSIGQVLTLAAAAYATGGVAGAVGASTSTASSVAHATSLTGIGLSAYGGGRSEAYASGATDKESQIYGAISGGTEVLSESLFGMGGKIGEIMGLNKSSLGLDDALVEATQKKLKSNISKTLAEFAIKSAGEGVEEIASGLMSAIGKKLTYMDDESLKELIKDENLWESFYMGALSSAILQSPTTVRQINSATKNLATMSNLTNVGITENQIRDMFETKGYNKYDVDTLMETFKHDPNNSIKLQENQALVDLDSGKINSMDSIELVDTAITKLNNMLSVPRQLYSNENVKESITKLDSKIVELENRRKELIQTASVEEKIDVVKKIDQGFEEVGKDITNANHIDKAIEANELTESIDSELAIPVMNNTREVNKAQDTKYTEAQTLLDSLKEQYPDANMGEIITNPNKAQEKAIEIGAAFGKQVVFIKGGDFSGLTTPNNSNIIFINDKIESGLLAKTTNSNATLYTLGHEMWHTLSTQNPQVYSDFVDFVKDTITDEQLITFLERYDSSQSNEVLKNLQVDGEFNLDAIRNNPQLYVEQNTELNKILDEMVANEFGGMITDIDYMSTLQKANPSLFTRVVDAIKNFFKALTKPVYKTSLTQYQVASIRNQFESIVKTLTSEGKITEETSKVDKITRHEMTTEGNVLTESDLPQLEEEYKKAPLENVAPPETETMTQDSIDSGGVIIRSKPEIINDMKNYFAISQQESRNLYNTIASKANTIEDVIEELQAYQTIKINEIDTELKELQKELKNIKINYSNIEMTDFNEFRKSNFGKLRLSKTGSGIDSVYQELSDMYPQYFPNDIIESVDQLEYLANIANLDTSNIQEIELDDSFLYDAANTLYRDIQNRERYLSNKEQHKEIIKSIKPMEAPPEIRDFDPNINVEQETTSKAESKLLKKDIKKETTKTLESKKVSKETTKATKETTSIKENTQKNLPKQVNEQVDVEFEKRIAENNRLAEEDAKKRKAWLEKQAKSAKEMKTLEIKDIEPYVDTTATTKTLNLDERFDMIQKSYERYSNETSSIKKENFKRSAYNAYNFYKNAGGTKVIIEFEAMRKANVKLLPNTKTRKTFSNTMQNSEVFEDLVSHINTLDVNNIIRNYESISSKEVLQNAYDRINENGLNEVFNFFNKDRLTSDDIGTACVLMEYAKNTNNLELQRMLGEIVAKEGTTAGQTISMFKLFKQLDPRAFSSMQQNKLTSILEQLQASKDPTIMAWLQEQQNLNEFTLTESEIRWIEQMKTEADKYSPDSKEYQVRYAQIYKYLANKVPPTLGNQIVAYRRLAMLGNTKTWNKNFLGNVPMVPINAAADFFGSYVDKTLAKKTGYRTTGNMSAKTFLKGAKQGVAQTIESYKLGIDMDPMKENYTFQTRDPFSTKTKLGKVGNTANKITSLALRMGDAPFSQGYYENEIRNQLRLNDTDVVTESMKKLARERAEKRTWQNNGRVAQIVSGFRKTLNKASIKGVGLGDLVAPFVMAPANLAVASYEYSPAAVIDIYNNAKQFNEAVKTGVEVAKAQAALVDSIGKVSASVILYTLAYLLAKQGITTGDEDEDKDVREMMKAQGFQPFSFQIGDKSYTYDWAQPLSTPLAIMSELQRTSKLTGEKQDIFDAIYSAFTIGGSRLTEQSFLYTIRQMFEADDPITGMIDALGTVPSSFIPTAFKQMADLIDPTTKVTYDKNSKLKTIINKTIVKVPGLKSTLPTKKNVTGQDVQLYGGNANLFNVFFNPTNSSQDTAGELGGEIMDVYGATGNKSIMPQVAVSYFDADINGDGVKERVTFSNEEQAAIQQMMGETYMTILNDMLNSDLYQNATYDERATALTSLSSYAKTQALIDSGLLGEYAPKSGDAAQIRTYISNGMTPSNAVMYDSLINSIDSLKDDNGDTISGSKKGQQAYEIMNMAISDEQKNIMLTQISSTSKYPETVSTLSNLRTKQDFINYYSLSRHDYYTSENFSRDDYDSAVQYYSFNGSSFMEYANELSNMKSDYDSNGNTISGSKKKKVLEYINSLSLTEIQKVFLYNTTGYSVKQWKSQLYQYINNLNITKEEKEKLWSDLGF